MKFERGTKIGVTVTNGFLREEIYMIADGDWVSDEKSAKRMAQSMTNSEWKVLEVRVIKF